MPTTYSIIDEKGRMELAGRVADAIRTLGLEELEITIRPAEGGLEQVIIFASHHQPLERITGIWGAQLPGEVASSGGGTVHRQIFVDRWGRVGFCGWFPHGFAEAVQPLRDAGVLVLM